MLGTSETRLTNNTNLKQDHGITKFSRLQTHRKNSPPHKQGNISHKWYNFCHLSWICPRERHGHPQAHNSFYFPRYKHCSHTQKRTEWIVPIFAKHCGKESVTCIHHQDSAGSSTKPKGHMVKKRRGKKTPSKSQAIWNITVPSTCKERSAREMGGPMPPLDHKASDIHWRETNPEGKR